MKRLSLLAVPLALAALFALTATSAGAAVTAVYDSIPSPTPGNVVSQAFQAQQTDEFGDHIGFAPSENERELTTVDVLMSSWACETGHWTGNPAACVTTPGATYTHPLTLTLYEVGTGGVPGDVIASLTLDAEIPYRPSADSVNCSGGAWHDAGKCYNGYAFEVTFDLTSLHIPLPEELIWGLSFNTTTWGNEPIGAAACGSNCPYDSLNVGLNELSAPSVGTDVDPDAVYWDTTYPGSGGDDTFRENTGWTGYVPAARFSAEVGALPAEIDAHSFQLGSVFWIFATLELGEGSDGIHPTSEGLTLWLGEQEVVFKPSDLSGSSYYATGATLSDGVVANVWLIWQGPGRYLLIAFGYGADDFESEEIAVEIGDDATPRTIIT